MKKSLISPEAPQFKANLHSHSTLSDGNLTPEEMKAAYKARGYSVLAITDHELLVDHSQLCDDDFLLLTAYEAAFDEPQVPGDTGWKLEHCCHLNLYARDRRSTAQVFYDPQVFARSHPGVPAPRYIGEPVKRVYAPDCINACIRAARENGFIVSYNHPTWSLEDYPQYSRYEGMFTMEISNGVCASVGAPEYNPRVYDDMLKLGRRISCSSADDNHNDHPFGDPRCDSFRGFVMIQAPSLAYDEIFSALERGDFYASQGPVITSLTLEDGELRLVCPPAKRITAVTPLRKWRIAQAADGGSVTELAFPVEPDDGYVRFEIVGHDGRCANTRAYFADELL